MAIYNLDFDRLYKDLVKEFPDIDKYISSNWKYVCCGLIDEVEQGRPHLYDRNRKIFKMRYSADSLVSYERIAKHFKISIELANKITRKFLTKLCKKLIYVYTSETYKW